MHWGTDEELYGTIRRALFTAVVGDVMDTMGLLRQFLPPQIKPLRNDMVVTGRALTVLEADVFVESHDPSGTDFVSEPFGLMFRALDDLKAEEVYICTGGSPRYALWGELMSTRAQTLGAAGAVVDGYHRDTRGIRRLGFPVFSYGSYAQDQRVRGRVIDYRCPIEFGNGARVDPGDVIVGDIDGVLVIPHTRADEIISAALEKVEGEEAVRLMIERGESTEAIFGKT